MYASVYLLCLNLKLEDGLYEQLEMHAGRCHAVTGRGHHDCAENRGFDIQPTNREAASAGRRLCRNYTSWSGRLAGRPEPTCDAVAVTTGGWQPSPAGEHAEQQKGFVEAS